MALWIINIVGALAVTILFLAVVAILIFLRLMRTQRRPRHWNQIRVSDPVDPAPRFVGWRGAGPVTIFLNWLVTYPLLRWIEKRRGSRADSIQSMIFLAELYDEGAPHKRHNPSKAFRLYLKVLGGSDPALAEGPIWVKMRLAEMYEDAEGVEKDIDMAGRIFATIPTLPSAMLHFALSHLEGRRRPQDHVEVYKWLLCAERAYSIHPFTREEISISRQRYRENIRFIKVKQLKVRVEKELSPIRIAEAESAAKTWWSKHR